MGEGAHSQPLGRLRAGASLCMPLCQAVGGWVGWEWGLPPPFTLLSVSFFQGRGVSKPVMLMCLFTFPALGDNRGLGGQWGGAWLGSALALSPLCQGCIHCRFPRQKGRGRGVSTGAVKCLEQITVARTAGFALKINLG